MWYNREAKYFRLVALSKYSGDGDTMYFSVTLPATSWSIPLATSCDVTGCNRATDKVAVPRVV